MSDTPVSSFATQPEVRGPWRKYLDDLMPIRPALYRFCLNLTNNPWDAEDLAQDTLLRVFSALGKTDREIENPKAYLIRTATNLWVDSVRRQVRHQALLELESEEEADSGERKVAASEAAQQLLRHLYPQERAALVMKDVLGHSLAEVAGTLNTSVGAVKSALHRARSRLGNDGMQPANFIPGEAIVEQFMLALENSDLNALRSLCAADLHVELVGGAEFHSFEDSSDFFAHAHFVMPEIGFGENPTWKLAEYAGEPVVIGLRTLDGKEGLNEIHRLEVNDGKISRVRCYCFCPDTLRAIADELGIHALERPYRSPSF